MASTEDLSELLRIAFEQKNWEETYHYATILIESNPQNGLWWAYKGLATAYLSTPNKPTFCWIGPAAEELRLRKTSS